MLAQSPDTITSVPPQPPLHRHKGSAMQHSLVLNSGPSRLSLLSAAFTACGTKPCRTLSIIMKWGLRLPSATITLQRDIDSPHLHLESRSCLLPCPQSHQLLTVPESICFLTQPVSQHQPSRSTPALSNHPWHSYTHSRGKHSWLKAYSWHPLNVHTKQCCTSPVPYSVPQLA